MLHDSPPVSRLILLILAALATGCVHPTPMMTPETLVPEQTRVEGGFGAPFQPSVRLRHGVTERFEVGARADVYPFDSGAVVLGGDASVQVVRPRAPGRFGVVANLGVSGTLAPRQPTDSGFVYVYPAVIAGAETLYGGVRGLVSLDGTGENGVGPFIGIHAPASSGVSRYYLGLEVAMIFLEEGDRAVYPALTFGRRQNR